MCDRALFNVVNAQADAHVMRARIEGWRITALAQKLSSRPNAGDQHRPPHYQLSTTAPRTGKCPGSYLAPPCEGIFLRYTVGMKKPTRVSSCTQDHIDKGMEYINGGYLQSGVVPTTDGLAIAMDVCRKTPYNWAEQESNQFREEMAYILDRAQALQGDRIVNGGLSGEMNATVVGKMLANHGFNQTSAVDVTSSDGSMKPTQIIITSADDQGDS